jgi:hypothetical protein
VPRTFTDRVMSACRRSAASRRRRAISVTLGIALIAVSATATSAATALPPRTALLRAQSSMHALANQATTTSSKTSAVGAARALTRALDPALWINANDAVAPAYGARIFTASAAAVHDLQALAGSAATPPGLVVQLIIGADRGLAQGMIRQAGGGNPGLLAVAKGTLAVGDGSAAAGRLQSAVRSYARAWELAFRTLTELIADGVTEVASSAAVVAAENALGSKKIGLAGPMIQHGLPPLVRAGKPELFYAGSEACPFCGVERWGMIVALSRFGTFRNLHLMQSASTERPQVRTFTFFGSSYRSPYISFKPVEVWSNVKRGFGFAHLQRLTGPESALVNRFDPPGLTPFIDVGGFFTTFNSTVLPHLLGGMSWTRIVRSMSHPNSIPAQAVAGDAEVLTAELCVATHGNPASVCSTSVVKQYEAALPFLNGRGGGCPAPASATLGRRRHLPRARATRCVHK